MRYFLARIQIDIIPFFLTVRMNLYVRNLYYPIIYQIQPRCLQVKDNQGL